MPAGLGEGEGRRGSATRRETSKKRKKVPVLWRRLPRAAAGEAGTGKVKLLPHPACSLSELVSLGLAQCREKRVPPGKKAAGPGRGAAGAGGAAPHPELGRRCGCCQRKELPAAPAPPCCACPTSLPRRWLLREEAGVSLASGCGAHDFFGRAWSSSWWKREGTASGASTFSLCCPCSGGTSCTAPACASAPLGNGIGPMRGMVPGSCSSPKS